MYMDIKSEMNEYYDEFKQNFYNYLLLRKHFELL